MEEVYLMMSEEKSRVGRGEALSRRGEARLQVTPEAPPYRERGALEESCFEVGWDGLYQVVAAALERRDLECARFGRMEIASWWRQLIWAWRLRRRAA